MVFNLYILIISDLLVSRTPLITVLSAEGLSWVNIPFINIPMLCLAFSCILPSSANQGRHARAVDVANSHRSYTCNSTRLKNLLPFIYRIILTLGSIRKPQR